jgi:signal transduction histidine kinase
MEDGNFKEKNLDTGFTKSTGVMFFIKSIPIIFFVVFVILPIFHPEFFPWIVHKKVYFIILTVMLAYQVVMLIISEVFKKQSLWMYVGYVFIIFFIFFIYSTGGLDSSMMFIMFSVPLISSSYLNLKITRNIGIASVIGMFLLIFFDKNYLTNPAYITKHILHVSYYAVMVFYLYRIIKDVLYQRYEKERLQIKFVQINEIDKVKKIFLTAISHQLRTPLAGARWALGTAIEDKNCTNKELLTEALNKIVQSIDIVGEILKSAEYDLGDGKIKLNKSNFILSDLVKNIISSLNFLIQGNGITLSYGEMSSFEVNGDEKMLGIVLVNVFDNAFRYSPKGKVFVSVKKEGSFAKITVKDSGIGIDSSDMEYVFQKFFRGKNAMVADPNESGVGLYATKEIIEMHGGEIKLSSILNKGTTVEITLPLLVKQSII